MSGDISGATVSNLTRAAATYKGVSTAQTHTAGDAVILVASFGSMRSMFPTKIDEVILAAPQANIDFPSAGGSLPTSYRHLLCIFQARNDVASVGQSSQLRFNGDSGANYDQFTTQIHTATPAIQVETYATTGMVYGTTEGSTSPAGSSGQGEFYVLNYSGTTFHKFIDGRANHLDAASAGNWYTEFVSGRWRNTAAITSIRLICPSSGNYIAGSSFTLYGIP